MVLVVGLEVWIITLPGRRREEEEDEEEEDKEEVEQEWKEYMC